MKLRDILHPWAALAEARATAERWQGRAGAYSADATELRRVNDELTIERNEAWAKLDRRSAGISKGNRTRGQKRRGGLLPFHDNDTAGAEAPHLRTELTG